MSSAEQLTNILMVILMVMVFILMALAVVLIVVRMKSKQREKGEKITDTNKQISSDAKNSKRIHKRINIQIYGL